jgi:hypothetical protein
MNNNHPSSAVARTIVPQTPSVVPEHAMISRSQASSATSSSLPARDALSEAAGQLAFLANNLQQSWRFDWEPPKAVLRDVWTIDWILGC